MFSAMTSEAYLIFIDRAALAETYYYESINGFIKPFGTTGKLS